MDNKSPADRPIKNGDRTMEYEAGFGPLGPLVAGLPLRKIDGMTSYNYIESLFNRLIDVKERGLYSGKMIAAGTTVKKGTYNFFDKAKNDSAGDKSLDGSLTISNLRPYTNMTTAGAVAGGHTQIVESLQIAVVIPTREFSGLDTATQMPSGGTNAAAADTKSATNDYLALAMNSKVTLSEPDFGEYASGKIWKFPSDQVPYGVLGGGTNEGFVGNGGRPKFLRFIRVLQENHHFDLEWEFLNDTLFTHNIWIFAALVGLDLVG